VAALADPLKVMISGAPASGKGTQCEFIKAKVSDPLYASVSVCCLLCALLR
jgi:nucleoside-triphosphatase THEP1